MKLYDQIKQIELNYNLCKIEADEAKAQAIPLIEEFNQKSQEIAVKYNRPATKLSIKKFAFGR